MRTTITLLAALMFLAGSFTYKASAEPDYAKWGRLAMKETAKRYQADIVDYKHLGRKTEQPGILSESFRLLLNKGNQKFGVKVSIWFDRKTEHVIKIRFAEDGKSVKKTMNYKMI
ncbi:DUF3889 domain-containing protein [Paenibacillus nasutitermitis]|uniref:DUF3889 domain-containing protein n=1 Tax=Paenibacillus nasutitermitis TaxID=1652958 RepID=A0A916YYW7_9BACL|nr:DUF3889 domain-containing protein [Paenibacillus nasutitermitis]GGD67616.1 hypothetical protein GCM10010911_26770 [Paenibacillus nasutitermitis]